VSESRLDSLLLAWQEERQQGRDVPAGELCRDCPELAGELNRRIGILRRMNDLMGSSRAPAGSAATLPLAPDKNGAGTLPPMPVEPPSINQPRRAGGADPYATLPTNAVATGVHVPSQSPEGYEILGELGRGGMGVVYKARQVKLRRIVALKMILAAGHAHHSELERFRTEAEAIARLQHPHIVQIYEVGEHDGLPYFSLEFCGGGSLEKKLAGTPQAPEVAATLVEKISRAVQAAHDHGVIHRDLKPGNILLQISDGRLQIENQQADGPDQSAICNLQSAIPKITDFGLAKKLDEAGQTQSGSIMGTPSYMAPEQAAGMSKQLGPACDIYALGAILYEVLTGRPPFKAATALETLMQVTSDEPVPPGRLQPKLPRDLETICLKCLRKEPEKRYGSALELAEDLKRFRNGEPVRARATGQLERAWRWCRRNPAVAASLLTVVLALLAGTVVSAVFGWRAEAARVAEAEHAHQEKVAKQEADQARRDAQRQLIELCGASGLAAASDGDHSLALLWFARAVQLANDDPRQEELNRIRIANWLRQVCLPEGTFAVPGFRQNLDRFRAFQFSPDGNYLLVAASTGDCLVWDRRRGRLVPLPDGAAKGVAAAWQPRSKLLAIADEAGVVRFLAAPDFQPVDYVPASAGIGVLAFTRDGKRLAWGGSDGARVWDREAKGYITPVLPHGGRVNALSFSSTGELLATADHANKARVFRVPSEDTEPLFPPVPHDGGDGQYAHTGPAVACPRFAAADQILLTAERKNDDTALKWRSSATGMLLSSSTESAVFAVSEQGNHIASLGATKGRLLNAFTRQVLSPIPASPPGMWNEHVIFSADEETLVTCSHDTRARFWSIEDRSADTLSEAYPAVYHPMLAVRVGLTANGRHLATALWDGTVYLWHLPSGPPIAYLAQAGGTSVPALAPDKKFVMPRGISYRSGNQLETRVYDAQTGKPAGATLDPGGILIDAAFSPDGKQVATASSTGRTPLERNHVLFAPDGRGGNVQIWDWKTGKRLIGPIPTPGEPRGLAFRPDGSMLAIVCADYRVLLVEPKTGTIRHRLDPGLRTRPNNANQWQSNGEARFSLDGRFLVTWEMTSHVHVWDPDHGRLLHTLPHNERVHHVSFTPTAPELAATAGWGSEARVWSLSSGKLLASLKHPQWVAQLLFSPDGKELITSAADGLLRTWDWQTGKLRDGWPFHSMGMDFRFTSDRRWLVTTGADDLQVIDWPTKTPVSPRWKTKPHSTVALEIPAGDRRAITGGFSPALVAYDLETIVTPAADPVADLAPLVELAAGRRILSQGNVVPINSAEWLERWDALRRKGIDRFQKAADDDDRPEAEKSGTEK